MLATQYLPLQVNINFQKAYPNNIEVGSGRVFLVKPPVITVTIHSFASRRTFDWF